MSLRACAVPDSLIAAPSIGEENAAGFSQNARHACVDPVVSLVRC